MRAFMTTSSRKRSRIGATYSIPLDSIGPTLLEDEKARLTMTPKSSFGPSPPAITTWFEEDGYFHMPRFYGLERFGTAEVDYRTDGDELPSLSFNGTLRDIQKKAVDTLIPKYFDLPESKSSMGGNGAMICIPCGFGKTILAVYIITQILKRKACIMVHKGVIRDQWKEAFERFCPGIKVGIIQGKLWQVDGYDVTIAMVMTLAKRSLPSSHMSTFGTVCVDECHHLAAPVMSRAMRSFDARNVIGLTATKDRPDGLTPLLHWTLGPEGFRAERSGGESVRVSIALFPTGIKEIRTKDGKPLTSVMLTKLADHLPRNQFISSRIVAMRNIGRVIMVLSDRIRHLENIMSLLLHSGINQEDIGMFHAATKECERAEQLGRPIVLCSYGMANEGLDKKEADTLIMAGPKGRVTQCIGRIQRECHTKMAPIVLDVVDDVPCFQQLRWTRQRLYQKEKYMVQVVNALEDGAEWFA